MKQSCEICWSDNNITAFYFGGNRPSYSHRMPDMHICEECLKTAKELLQNRLITFRSDHRDTTNSRYSRIKAGVKRARFGHPNINCRKLQTQQI